MKVLVFVSQDTTSMHVTAGSLLHCPQPASIGKEAMMPAEHFDIAVVGGGKGGKTLAVKMASAGRRVVMIEQGMIGGSCINVACIPTKTLVQSAKVAELSRRAAALGLRVGFAGVDAAGLRQHKRAVVAEMVARNQANFDHSGMTLLIGTARFTGPRELDVSLPSGDVRRLAADQVFINTGTRPALPPIPGLAAAQALNIETIQELDHMPKHLLILGAGYVGCEFAQMYRRFGSRVTLIEGSPDFLPREDRDIAAQVKGLFEDDGIDLQLGAQVQSVSGQSAESVRVALQTPSGAKFADGTHLLAALGRVPNTEALNLAAAGVATNSHGFIQVNERLETTAPGIWALGDVKGGPQFTHISLDDFRIVAANLAGGKRSTADRPMPYVMFIDPELARVGLTEAEARQRGLSVRVARLPAKAVPRAMTSGETRGLMKAVVEASTDRILGAAILAAGGGEVMSVIQVAMQAGLRYTALRDGIFAHPTMSEGLNDLFAHLEP
ncbi:MAG TPA: mercuric reductase [Chloroflexia bacterium]|nr:mercuric reductase [Chloroflexia bacterium]